MVGLANLQSISVKTGAIAIALSISLLLSYPAFAQESLSSQVVGNLDIEPEAPFGFANGSVIVAPIPLSDPTLGTGLVVAGGYLFNADAESNSSYFGLGALRTDTGSIGYGFSSKIYLDSNRWQFGISGGYVDLNYDLFVLGVPIPLNQKGSLVQANFAYGITKEFSLGVDARYLETKIAPAGTQPGSLPAQIFKALDTEILNLGVTANLDRRDDTIYPTSGTFTSLNLKHGEVLSGLADNYQKANFTLNGYKQVFGKNVIAAKFSACAASDGAPFYDSCGLGGSDSFRGFPSTEFIDRNLLSIQAAWRGSLNQRFGYAVFAGAGAVGSSFGNVVSGPVNTAAGVGGRFRLSKKFPLDFSLDGTVNDQGETLYYLYIGQRF